MQNTQGGLLGGMQAPQQPQGGLLGAMSAQAPQQQAPQDNGAALQMAQQLAQNPTPETGQAIVAQMRQAGMPEADQIAMYLQHVGNDPAAIKQAATQVIQALSQ